MQDDTINQETPANPTDDATPNSGNIEVPSQSEVERLARQSDQDSVSEQQIEQVTHQQSQAVPAGNTTPASDDDDDDDLMAADMVNAGD